MEGFGDSEKNKSHGMERRHVDLRSFENETRKFSNKSSVIEVLWYSAHETELEEEEEEEVDVHTIFLLCFPFLPLEKREQERGSRQQELRGQSVARGGAAGVGVSRGPAMAVSQQPMTAKSRSLMHCYL